MKKRALIVTIIFALASLAAAGTSIKKVVYVIPHMRLINVNNGCMLNGEPFGKTLYVRTADDRLIWEGRSEYEAVRTLLNDCP